MNSTLAANALSVSGSTASRGRLWTGRVLAGLVAAFMLLDAIMKLINPVQVHEAFARSGWPLHLSPVLGVILLTSTILFIIPRTAFLGAILLTAYLGGAVATNLRLENPLFTYTLFPVYFGVLLWGSLWLRDSRIAALIPFQKNR
ncbi:MAG TPA: DoxX family protein [Acidobacteriaceae bacterium]|nr:DoxX family protein [Acidobacteriaceae bacterium]